MADLQAPGRLSRILLVVEDYSRRHYRLVLGLALGVMILGTAISATLHLDTDILDLLPRHQPAVEAFRETARVFGALDTFPIMLDAPEGFEASDYEDFADRLSARLRQDPLVAAVDARLDLDSPLVAYLQERLPLFLDQAGLDELGRRLQDDSIRATVADDRVALSLPAGGDLKAALVKDPLQLSRWVLARAGQGHGGGAGFFGGYVTSQDGKALLLFLRPLKPAQDVHSAAELVKHVNKAVADTVDEQRHVDKDTPAPKVRLGGRYAISVEDNNLILGDVAKTMTLSFFGVIGLYLFCYRRLGAVLYSALPLLIGQVLTFTLARVALGSLNSATATSAALLMGLGTDFTIVMYARYVEERRAGLSIEQASRIMMGEAALGVYTGALTSAGTFGALIFTSFVGLREFGFLVGAGILLCLACILLMLPALVVAFEGRKRAKPPTLYVHSFGFERIIPLARRYPWVTVAACLAVSAAALPLALSLKLRESVQELRSSSNAGIQAQEEIGRRFGRDENFLLVMSRGATEDETLTRARKVETVLERLRADGKVARVEGLSALLPEAAAQEASRQRLMSGEAAFDPDRIEKTLRAALVAEGFKDTAFDAGIASLRRSLRPDSLVTPEGLSAAGGADLVGRYLRKDGSGSAAVAWVFGQVDESAMADLKAANPDVTVTGVSILSKSLKVTIRHDVLLCLVLGFVLVAVLLWLDFGTWRLAGLAMVQLVVGLLWMLGAMKVCGVHLTMVNAFAAALLLGVGIDYGIHILHRLQGPEAASEESICETGKAVAMAAMTNVVGFGVLLFSNYPGLKGLGSSTMLGSIGCMLTALTLMPALEVLTRRPAAPKSPAPQP